MGGEQDQHEAPDFDRGLHVSDRVGHEFASVGSSGVLVTFVVTQGFAMLTLFPIVLFYALRHLAGASMWVAGGGAGLVGGAIVVAALLMLMRVNQSSYKGGGFFRNESDSRSSVRAVIPKKRRNERLMRWVDAAIHAERRDREPVREEELEIARGGFDPVIVRPWFGVQRGRAFWLTAVPMGLLCAAGLLQLMSLFMGGWSGVLKASGFMGYAVTGAGMVGGVVCAELMWPVYLRIVPGRLDIFRYGFLGSGVPDVETHSLRTQGVCVDFGSYTMALEPERPLGEALPALVQAKRWPHGQTLPEGFVPRYVCIGLVVGRREIAQQVIQAARCDEPAPRVSETELMG